MNNIQLDEAIKILTSSVDNLLLGTPFDQFGNRDDDSIYRFLNFNERRQQIRIENLLHSLKTATGQINKLCEWQAIDESTPQDTPILVKDENGLVSVAEFTFPDVFGAFDTNKPKKWCVSDGKFDHELRIQPILWKQLP